MESIVRVYYIEGWVRVCCGEQRRPPSPTVVGFCGPRRHWVPAKFVVPFPGWMFSTLWVRITVVAFGTNGVGVATFGHVDLLARCKIASLQLTRWCNIASPQLTLQHTTNELIGRLPLHMSMHYKQYILGQTIYISDTKNPRDKELITMAINQRSVTGNCSY
jgi:hypothetical protein